MAEEGGNNMFIYMGGDQEVPRGVTHVRIHESVKIITRYAFRYCRNLVSIEMHDGVEIIEIHAFNQCTSLRSINLPGVRVIEKRAFEGCDQLTEVELSEFLETIGGRAFQYCPRLRRIAMPLKDKLLRNIVFYECYNLSKVDIVGGIHKTVSSLLLETWRNEMNNEIDSINRDLPSTSTNDKTRAIRQWTERVTQRIEHYKSEHYTLLKENMTQLELALWDANLLNVDAAASRHDARFTCGANIIIPHVLSFLNDADEFPLLDCDLAALRV